MRRAKIWGAGLAALALGLLVWPDQAGARGWPDWTELVGLAYRESITPADLASRYRENKLKILLIPGHDNEYSGAVFGGQREADLNLALTRELYRILRRDKNFEVISARDLETGDYTADIKNYFTEREEVIENFVKQKKERFEDYLVEGEIERKTFVSHNRAPAEVAFRLYGLNKWANGHDVDIMLHVHFNDYAGRRSGVAGRHSGFSIYVPERQLPNSRASLDLALPLFNSLRTVAAVSDLPKENLGIIEDQELIAIGAYGTQKGASLLIEYGYIYEPQFISLAVREKLFSELALRTYHGLKKYFGEEAAEETVLLPHHFEQNLEKGMKGRPEVLALQRALAEEGAYPPAGTTLNKCPINGNFGDCVVRAVVAFQTRHNLPATGAVGELTRAKLNEKYGE